MSMTTNSLSRPKKATLESVHEAFTQWRKHKSAQEKIPNQLWSLVGQIIERYKMSQIMTRLGINNAQLKQAGLLPRPIKTKNKPFVNVTLSSPLSYKDNTNPSATAKQLQLILEREDGKRLIVSNPSESQTAIIIQQFLG